MPYTTRVIYDGYAREMDEPQTELNCAVCHTAKGEGDALGWLVVPQRLLAEGDIWVLAAGVV